MRATTRARNVGRPAVPILCTPLASGTGFARETVTTDTTPVPKDFAGTLTDPSISETEDGHRYCYRTDDPLREGWKGTCVIPMVLALQV